MNQESVTKNRISNKEQNQKSRNQRLSGDFVCDVCGAKFSNERSLAMHKLRKHHIKPSFLVKPKEGGPPPAIENELLSAKNRYALEFRELSKNEERVLDPYLSLYEILRKNGISKQVAFSIISYVENLNLDNPHEFLRGLSEGMSLNGISKGKKILILRSYALQRGWDLSILSDLGLRFYNPDLDSDYSDYQRYRYGGPQQPKTEPVVDSLSTELVRSNSRITEAMLNRVLNAKNNGGDSLLVQQLLEQNRRMEEHVKMVEAQLRKQENENLRNEIKRLEDKIENNQNAVNQYSIALKKLDVLNSNLHEVIGFVKALAVVPSEKPPKRKESKESSEHDVEIPEELFVEEA